MLQCWQGATQSGRHASNLQLVEVTIERAFACESPRGALFQFESCETTGTNLERDYLTAALDADLAAAVSFEKLESVQELIGGLDLLAIVGADDVTDAKAGIGRN
jgi:hypothetical protein